MYVHVLPWANPLVQDGALVFVLTGDPVQSDAVNKRIKKQLISNSADFPKKFKDDWSTFVRDAVSNTPKHLILVHIQN